MKRNTNISKVLKKLSKTILNNRNKLRFHVALTSNNTTNSELSNKGKKVDTATEVVEWDRNWPRNKLREKIMLMVVVMIIFRI